MILIVYIWCNKADMVEYMGHPKLFFDHDDGYLGGIYLMQVPFLLYIQWRQSVQHDWDNFQHIKDLGKICKEFYHHLEILTVRGILISST